MTTNPRDKVDSNGSVDGRGASRTSGRGVILAAFGLGMVLAGEACSSNMSDQKTGERHFFACKNDDECRKLGSGYYCAVDHCEDKTNGGGGTANGGAAGGGTANGGATGGGTANGGAGGAGVAGASGAPPGGSGGDDFAQCARRPPSTCSREETCKNLDCGGPEFDENGCGRATCKADADCGADERCASMMCVSHGSCDVMDGKCSCVFLTDCGQGYFCDPVADAGPRGDWVSLVIGTVQSPCSPSGCTSTWKVGPDGHVTGQRPGKTIDAQLDQLELSQMKYIVYSTELRKGLEEGMSCFNQQVFDFSAGLTLTLSTREYMHDVSGCVDTGPIGDAYRILSRF